MIFDFQYTKGQCQRFLIQRAERTLRFAQEHWTRHGYGLWAVTERTSGQFIGQSGLNYLDETGEVEVDYALARAYWGRGIATEVARASLRFGFKQLGLARIIGLAALENIASRRALAGVLWLAVKLVSGRSLKARGSPSPFSALERAWRAPRLQ